MRRSKSQILDSNPDSIFGASKKLASIAVHNMKNPSDNDGMAISLDSILKSPSTSTSTTNSNNLLINRLPVPTASKNIQMTKSNTDVDEFLVLIKETNSVLESLDLVLDSYMDDEEDDDEEEEIGLGLYGGADNDEDEEPNRKLTAEEHDRLVEDQKHNDDDKFLPAITPNDTDDEEPDYETNKRKLETLSHDMMDVINALNSLEVSSPNIANIKKSFDTKIADNTIDYNELKKHYDSILTAKQQNLPRAPGQRTKSFKDKYGITPQEFDDINEYRRIAKTKQEIKEKMDNLQTIIKAQENAKKERLARRKSRTENINLQRQKQESERQRREAEERTKELDYQRRDAEAKTKEAQDKKRQAETILSLTSKSNPVIDSYTKFNSRMNQLYIFYKGKIKPNIRSINRMKVEEMLEDINTLEKNFMDVSTNLKNVYKKVFNVIGERRETKVVQFIYPIERNVVKIFSDVISNLKSYSSVQQYGSGLQNLLPDAVRINMHHNHKYLL